MTGRRQPPTLEGREPFDARELEELGAYIDGGLEPEQRRRMAERLLEDEEFFELYAEALEFRVWESATADLDREVEAKGPVPKPAPRPVRWLQAAALALLLGGSSWWMILGRVPGRPVFTLADRIAQDVVATSTTAAWTQVDWFEPRIADGQGTLGGAQVVARLGVRLVQAHVAVRGGDREAVERLMPELRRLGDAADLAVGALRYSSALPPDPQPAVDSRTAERRLDEAQKELREAARVDGLEEILALAQWAELGRLASRSGRDDLVDASAFDRLERSWRGHSFDPPVAEALDEVRLALEAAESDPLEERFTALILTLAD